MSSAQAIQSRAMLFHHAPSSGAVEVTVHAVTKNQSGEHALGAGVLLGAEEKSEIVSILSGDSSRSEFTLLGANVLAQSSYGIAWWMPKAKRELLFRCPEKGVERVTIDFPTTIGIYLRGQVYYAATKGGKNKRPDADTPLYFVPLPNYTSNGVFCRGNVQLPAEARPKHIPAWEDFLWSTVNTHMGRATLDGVGTMQDMVELYRQVEQSGRFPVSKLMPMGMTLSEWMHSLDRRRGA